ncbi:Threonine/Serine Exporter [Shigella dysenteriae 1617]|uniref:Threonine/Serine Exporter n=1 Tax=Shigella dysenteriae 1617 TaxID=754093 RepID=A0A0A7A4R9_SHIDY|nr:Threonine/Serine Exporter [Shigella dysenteriae 1617]
MIQMDSHYLNNTQHVYDKGRVMQTEQQARGNDSNLLYSVLLF